MCIDVHIKDFADPLQFSPSKHRCHPKVRKRIIEIATNPPLNSNLIDLCVPTTEPGINAKQGKTSTKTIDVDDVQSDSSYDSDLAALSDSEDNDADPEFDLDHEIVDDNDVNVFEYDQDKTCCCRAWQVRGQPGVFKPMTSKYQWPHVDLGYKISKPKLRRRAGRPRVSKIKASNKPGTKKKRKCTECDELGHTDEYCQGGPTAKQKKQCLLSSNVSNASATNAASASDGGRGRGRGRGRTGGGRRGRGRLAAWFGIK